MEVKEREGSAEDECRNHGQKCLKFHKNYILSNQEAQRIPRNVKYKKCEENRTKEHHDQISENQY